MQIVEVRRALESEVAELAAQRRSEADVQAIREAMQRISDAVQAGRDGAEEDVEFHRAIARAAGNPFLISTLDYLARFLQGATRVTRANEARRSDFAQAVTQEHEQIVRAIESGDARGARNAATEHMCNALRRIEQADTTFWAQDGARLAIDPKGLLGERGYDYANPFCNPDTATALIRPASQRKVNRPVRPRRRALKMWFMRGSLPRPVHYPTVIKQRSLASRRCAQARLRCKALPSR